jgi:O-antigen chain-terminating methyltransferase
VSVYLNTIEHAKDVIGSAPILDLGCGRGEWLELLKERGYRAKGVDQNSVMVRQCRDVALDVTEQDAIDFLSQQPPNSVGAITGFHLVEHLSFVSMIFLIDESLRVLKPGGLAIFETPNPENLMVGAFSFYFDPSHRNPLPPGTLQFLLEQRGFVNTSVMKLHKYSDFVDIHDGDDFKNKWFYSDMDYSVIAFKNDNP